MTGVLCRMLTIAAVTVVTGPSLAQYNPYFAPPPMGPPPMAPYPGGGPGYPGGGPNFPNAPQGYNPYAQQRPPMFAARCYTQFGACPMPQPLALGSPCGCPSPAGFVPGTAGN